MDTVHSFRPRVCFILAALWILASPSWGEVADFDRFYPPYDEIVDYLEDIDSTVVATTVIGASDESTPRDLVAIKISDNPDLEEDEFGFLFVGVIHGNEAIGIQVVLQLIEDLVDGYASDPDIQDWIDAYEIWFIPVINPYGYDNNLRKNGPDTGDVNTSGVDLNRNFDFRWIEGGEAAPNSNTFRGPFAASEPEVQALSNFVIAQRPVFGVTFHSGRGGTIGEIMYPWNRYDSSDPHPDPPDRERLRAMAGVIADAVEAHRGYVDRPTLEDAGAIGQSNVYTHAVTGICDYMFETTADKWSDAFFSTVDIVSYTPAQQTRMTEAEVFVGDYYEGLRGLLEYFLYDTTGGFTFSGPGVTGRVTDCQTGDPLTATIKVLELDDTDGDGDVDDDDRDYDGDGTPDWLFRTSDPNYGRHMRFLGAGTWTLEFSLAGYPTFTTTETLTDPPGGTALAELDVVLDNGADGDGDGLTNCEEAELGTDPADADSDDDGLSDGDEVDVHGTDPLDADSDDDGLSDGDEVDVHGTDPLDADSDDDGLSDGDEVDVHGTDPLDADSDDDGLSDGDEVDVHGTDPLDADSDDDGLSDGDEVDVHGTDPLDADSDDDGLSDGDEVDVHGTDPLDADSDDDGLSDGDEVDVHGTDPLDADSDDDGLSDGDEVMTYGTDPLDADTDDDGLIDGDEVLLHGTNPLDFDTDDDGLGDGEEVLVYGTDPLDPDTDDDGLPDGDELELYGTDPLDSDTDDDGLPDGSDVEFIQNVVGAWPDSYFKSSGPDGLQAATLSILDEVEISLLDGRTAAAIRLLGNLRRKFDAGKNDWLLDSAASAEMLRMIDLLVSNLES